ncbi:MAG: DUF5979 domain-containing protein [Erysipelotrichia bacterium]|nr:DUF5979 domain-containing protein [Erysipelotrichia bacterium]
MDPRLTAEFVDFTSPIFVADVDNAKIEGSKVTVNCMLKDDWKEHIDELATTSMVVHGNGILKAEDFQVGDVLSTTGHIEVTAGIMSLYLPANVVNTLEVKRVGNLTITKVAEGAAIGSNDAFDLTVRLSDETITGNYGDLNFENGVAHATIHIGETLTAEELPAGVSYTVTEDSTSYEYVTTYENAEGTIEENQTSEVKIINTYNVGSLLITKTVKGIKTTEKFKIMIRLNEEINGYYNDILFENGIGYIELADGEEYVIDNLPSGINYLIEEVDVDETKYEVTYKNSRGMIGIDETVNIEVINTYQTKAPDTGDYSGIYYWVAIMFVSAVAVGFAVYKKKKIY